MYHSNRYTNSDSHTADLLNNIKRNKNEKHKIKKNDLKAKGFKNCACSKV
jgi:hypothetical protein